METVVFSGRKLFQYGCFKNAGLGKSPSLPHPLIMLMLIWVFKEAATKAEIGCACQKYLSR